MGGDTRCCPLRDSTSQPISTRRAGADRFLKPTPGSAVSQSLPDLSPEVSPNLVRRESMQVQTAWAEPNYKKERS